MGWRWLKPAPPSPRSSPSPTLGSHIRSASCCFTVENGRHRPGCRSPSPPPWRSRERRAGPAAPAVAALPGQGAVLEGYPPRLLERHQRVAIEAEGAPPPVDHDALHLGLGAARLDAEHQAVAVRVALVGKIGSFNGAPAPEELTIALPPTRSQRTLKHEPPKAAKVRLVGLGAVAPSVAGCARSPHRVVLSMP